MNKRRFVLNFVFFSLEIINLLYIQQISPQFICFISVSTFGEFQICGKFYIFYSKDSYILLIVCYL